jgi:hypothetical protein
LHLNVKVKFFQDFSCNIFYTLILKKPKLLKEICSSQKYGKSAQKGGTNYFNIRWKLTANEIL